jgi:hypothetical protein
MVNLLVSDYLVISNRHMSVLSPVSIGSMFFEYQLNNVGLGSYTHIFLVYLLMVRVCLQKFLSDHVIVFENRCEMKTKILDPCISGKLFTGKVGPTQCETNPSASNAESV